MRVSKDDIHSLKIDGRGRVTIPKDVREEWDVSSGDRLEVAVVGSDTGYTCDDCGDEFELPEVAIFNRGAEDERIVCVNCLTPADRIIE